MPAIPHDWTIIINGAWNLAILTPDGIARRMFALESGTPVEVHVALDRPASVRVLHNNIGVIPSSTRLTIGPTGELTRDALTNAARVASRALESLPITPVSASGVNIRYRFDALPDGFIAALVSQIDDRLADAHRTIVRRQLRRTIVWEPGALNIEVIENEDASGLLSFNFHRDSAVAAEHIGWLNMTAQMLTDAETLTTTLQNLE